MFLGLKFDSTISISDIISTLAIIGSFITILFLFVQRNDSAKVRVDIFFNKKSYGKKTGAVSSDVFPIIKAVNGNLATEINVTSTISFEKFPGKERAYSLLWSDRCFSPISEHINRYNYVNSSKSIVMKDGCGNYIEYIENALKTILIDLKSKRNYDFMSEMPFIVTKVNYKNIHGKSYTQYFKLVIVFESLKLEEEYMDYSTYCREISTKEYKRLLRQSIYYDMKRKK